MPYLPLLIPLALLSAAAVVMGVIVRRQVDAVRRERLVDAGRGDWINPAAVHFAAPIDDLDGRPDGKP